MFATFVHDHQYQLIGIIKLNEILESTLEYLLLEYFYLNILLFLTTFEIVTARQARRSLTLFFHLTFKKEAD